MASPSKSTARAATRPAAPARAAAAKKTPAPQAPVKKAAVKKAPAKLAAAPARASREPSLRFYHSVALGSKTHSVLSALEAAPDHPQHGEALADLVNELIDAGMDYYFLRALKLANMGFVAEQSARLGMSGAVKLISSVSRKFIVRMDAQQLLVVATHIRALGADTQPGKKPASL